MILPLLVGQVDAPRKILIMEKVAISGKRTEVFPIHLESCYF